MNLGPAHRGTEPRRTGWRAATVKILFLVTYYHPHLSGLTIAARNRAEGLAARGHEVTVICSQQRRELAREEIAGGVRVLRLPVRMRFGKGVWMPGYARCALKEARRSDVVVQCLPVSPPEALASTWAARRGGKPLILDYACDVRLPGGLKSRIIEAAVGRGHSVAARSARAIVVSTASYAKASPFLRRFSDRLRVVPLTIRIPSADREAAQAFRRAHAANGERLVGFAGRMSSEKGIEVLLEALRLTRARGRAVKLLLAGDVDGVIGERAYRERILRQIDALGDACRLLGVVKPDLSAFYAACDVLVLPSLNSTESFGMVQIEAMLCATPVVASRLPGVREPVEATGMGLLAEPGDAPSLANAIETVLDDHGRFCVARASLENRFSAEHSLDVFEQLLREVVR